LTEVKLHPSRERSRCCGVTAYPADLAGGILIERSPSRRVPPAKDVDSYIELAPKEVRARLREIRAAIREGAPAAAEGLSYGMPFYGFRGETGINTRLCYFGFSKTKLVFYTRPAFLEGYANEVEPYRRTRSALHFRSDRRVPVQLITRLVRNGVRKHEAVERARSREELGADRSERHR